MRFLGGLLLMLGFFGAAFVSVRHADAEQLDWQTIEWGWYVVAFAVGLIGVIVLRVTARSTGTQAHKLDADLEAMKRSLAQLVEKLAAMTTGRDAIGVYDVHDRIDNELMVDLNTFVEARESLIHLYGLQPYANLMNRFALSERNINRAWSASADGYIDEVCICMERAQQEMTAAQRLLTSYESSHQAIVNSSE